MTVKGRDYQLRSSDNFAHVVMSSDRSTKPEVQEFGEFAALNRRPRYYSAACDVFFGTSDQKNGRFVGTVAHSHSPSQKMMWEAFMESVLDNIDASCGASRVDFVVSMKVLIRNNPKGG